MVATKIQSLGLAVALTFTACSTSDYQLRQQAVSRLESIGVTVDDTLRCNFEKRDRGYSGSFLDMDAIESRVNQFFSDKGEEITGRILDGRKHLVLTKQGKVYKISGMHVFAEPSNNMEIYCAQASQPRVDKTDITPTAFMEKYNSVKRKLQR